MVDIKKPPYFSTFDEAQKYYRILARPGRPIQAREWNDLQEQIQKQIERVGAHLFENGAQVLPGTNNAVTYRNNVGFIKLSKATSPTTEDAIKNLWLNKEIVSTSAPLGVKARVIGYKVTDEQGEVRLFVDYVQADNESGLSNEFLPGQTVQTVETNPVSAVVSNDVTSVGRVSGVFIKKSVYFFNGDFILVDDQTNFIEPTTPSVQSAWTNTPTAKVGLSIVRSVVTFEGDEGLGDNSTETDSFGAPGADRLHISANLEQRDYNEQNDGQFIELIRISDGVVQEKVSRTEYSVIEDTLARRTYDESGDYTVKDFPLIVRPYLKTDGNSGVHTRAEFQFDTQEDAEKVGERIFGIKAACVDPELQSKWLPASSYSEFLRLADGKLTLQIDPGKAYVKGYEIEKVAPSYVDIDKARTLRFQNNRTVSTNIGTYVFITNVYGAPQVEEYELVEIHRTRKATVSDTSINSRIGTARILAVEYFSGTHGDPSAVYKLFLFDVKADDGFDLSQMKSIASTSGLSFSADMVLEFTTLEGSVETDADDDISGFGTSFVNKSSQKLSPYDCIRVGNSNSQIYQVEQVNSDTSVTLTTTPTFAGNLSVEFAYSSFYGLEDARGLLFPLPESFAYTLRSANSDNSIADSVIDTVFAVRRQFTAQADGAGCITIQTTLADEEFDAFSPNDYIVIDVDTTDWIPLGSGTSYNSSFSTAGVDVVSGSQVKIYADPASANHTFYIIATVRKTQGYASKEKSKTAIRGTFISGEYSGPVAVSADLRSDLGEISLGVADILKVTRIVMSPDYGTEPSSLKVLPTGHKDVTDRYLLDNGQTDYYYGIGSVYLKPGAERPSGRVRVEFDYFTHSAQGSYFSVDSYPFKGSDIQMDYSEIPSYADSSGRVFELRDCLDFRPRLNADGTFANRIEVPRSNVRLDFHHYLNRVDNLYLDRFGNFRVQKGTPDVIPLSPEEPGDAMSLYHLDIQAYTATPDQCFRRKIENRRYTMRDIGKIESRVSNLEYYTLLSLLEKEAKELTIPDAQGLDRFKNGFIVDNFKSFEVTDVANTEFKCAIDATKEELRPSICQKHVDLIEKNLLETNEVTRDQKRSADNYTRTGKFYTLPYSPTKFVEQELASQIENINPYAKFTFRGRVKLDPSTDSWRDTETLPVLTVSDDSAYQAAQAGVNPNNVMWGEWEKGWAHKDVHKKRLPDTVKYGPNKPDALHSKNWPRYVTKSTKFTTTTTTTSIRKGISESVVDKGVKTQSLGKRVVQTIAADYMRARKINIEARGFMPGSVLYAFFNDEPVGVYCNPKGAGLGQAIRADDTGSVDLVFELPAKKFLTGERIFKLTTSSTNEKNPQPASEGEAKYYAVGWIDQVQETELAIRQFEVQRNEVSDVDVKVSVDVKTKTKVVREDPIAQSFAILERGGCFLLAVDVYFFSKDPKVPVKLQVRPLSDDGYPTNLILPFGEVVKPAADVITNTVDLTNGKMTVTGDGTVAGYTVGPWDGSTSNPVQIQRVSNKSGRTIPNGESIDIQDVSNDMIPTRFVFESPIFLQENNDYAVVLLADSIQYHVWISQAGPITLTPKEDQPVFGKDINTLIGTNKPILKDNFLNGVFFRSSNGTTWNADQLIDMKFALHKATFTTNATGTIEYVNDELPVVRLVSDPIVTKEGSTKVRVLHSNHGHPAFASPAPRVVLSGVTTGNGIDLDLLNRSEGWPVESVELDSYIIDIEDSGTATRSGRTGGAAVTASDQVSLDSMFLNLNQLEFPETDLFWTYSSTNGGSVSYPDTNPKAAPFVVNAFREIESNTTIDFANPMTISSKINEHNSTDAIVGPSKVTSNGTGDRKSFRVNAVLRSSNSNLSPVLDADRLSAIAISNRINNPIGTGQLSLNTSMDLLQVVPTTESPEVSTTQNLIFFHADSAGTNKGRLYTNDGSIAQHLSKLDVGKLVSISGAAVGSRNCTDVRVLEVTYRPGSTPLVSVVLDTTFGGASSLEANSVTITQKDNFVDEIAPQGGSAAFKYVTKQLTLARQSTALKVSFDANRHVSHEIEVYYKVVRTDSQVPVDDMNWTKAEFNIEQGGDLVAAYPAPNSVDDQLSEYSATVNNLPPFTGVVVKLVGKGGNSAKPPRISNLKVIALDE